MLESGNRCLQASYQRAIEQPNLLQLGEAFSGRAEIPTPKSGPYRAPDYSCGGGSPWVYSSTPDTFLRLYSSVSEIQALGALTRPPITGYAIPTFSSLRSISRNNSYPAFGARTFDRKKRDTSWNPGRKDTRQIIYKIACPVSSVMMDQKTKHNF